MLRYFSLFFFLILLSACGSDDENAPLSPKKIQYLALGDSYTIGTAVDEDQRFPAQIEDRYSEMSSTIVWQQTTIIAQSGWRTDNLIQAINEADLSADFDLVTLCIGVNNQFQNGNMIFMQMNLSNC